MKHIDIFSVGLRTAQILATKVLSLTSKIKIVYTNDFLLLFLWLFEFYSNKRNTHEADLGEAFSELT